MAIHRPQNWGGGQLNSMDFSQFGLGFIHTQKLLEKVSGIYLVWISDPPSLQE